MQELDQKVGKNEYVLFISADHGVVDNPKYLVDHKYPGEKVGRRDDDHEIRFPLRQVG